MQTFSDKALELAPWSYSKARMALECPFKFRLKHVDREKEPPSGRSKELVIGSALHSALEFMIKGMPLDAAVEAALAKNVLLHDELDEFYASYDMLKAFDTRIKKFMREHGISANRLYVERRVAISASFKPASYWNDTNETMFRGQWDLGMHSASGYMVVIDHKRRGSAELRFYENQLKSYAITALALHPNIRGVKAGVHFVESGELMWAPTYSTVQIVDELQAEFIQWINKAAEEPSSDTIAVGNYCKWCMYKDTICLPERKLRRKEAREAGTVPNVISR